MNRTSALLYMVTLATTFFANKFVLTTLGFRYPMVFQGWQTLVGFLLYRILNSSWVGAPVKLTKIDASGFVSLFPAFLFFTSAILTGSMALSDVPVAAFIAVSAGIVSSLAFFHADYEVRRRTGSSESTPRNRIGAVVTGLAASVTLFAEMINSEREGYFWLGVHCVCCAGFVVYGRIADARFSSSDRQYYCYIFSLIILLPASLYLEEAFEALNFKELRQSLFIAGSLVCALSGMGLHLYQCRLRADKNFGRVHHVSLFVVSLLSLTVFDLDFATMWSLPTIIVGLTSLAFVPTYLSPEDFIPAVESEEQAQQPFIEQTV